MNHAADAALDAFQRERGRLFGIAYRMLGSVREAEDVLQDAYVRWHGVDHAAVEHPGAYLARLVTRLCLDVLKSAHARRTEYVGVWLPEPLVGPADDDPAAVHELADDLSLAFLFLLERLTPVERAVFLLRESFGFSHREVAGVVGKTEENCRQIERRARRKLAEARRPAPADPEEHDRLFGGFLRAVREGDVEGLVGMLAEDAVAYSDGGGRARAALNPVHGADRVARLLAGLARKGAPGWETRLVPVNGRTGLLLFEDGRPRGILAAHVEGGRIVAVFIVVNPDKLPPG
ncbi:MAG TPA: RNA polymerase sigma-70 factor [Longimicrobiaceae bacterium]|nr:RNA polymerase sigma-70 factor [Longimicrobiaceae bacterium]